MSEYIRASGALTPNLSIQIEAVNRLSSFEAVVTYSAHETTPEGFDAEWRMIQVLTVEGDRIDRCEIFDETDLDAALARFDELQPPKPRLENAATRVNDRFQRQYAARNWEAIADMLDDDFVQDDRRRVVGAGVRHGRDPQIADLRAIADVWVTNITPTVLATRGERLFLMRAGYSGGNDGSEVSRTETFVVVEINADGRIVVSISFDLDDLDVAFAELDARYLAGEAAAHSHTWSVITAVYTAFNRHELTGADWVVIDHRRGTPFASSNMTESIRAIWDLTPDLNIQIEAVHRLSGFGAVITQVMKGTSRDGFDAEWREIDVLTVERDLISRCEMFDETDLDVALARFEELHPQARRLENAASQAYGRIPGYVEARDWDALTELSAENISVDDRRRVVNAGIRNGRDAAIEDLQAATEVGFTLKMVSVIATRGARLALVRVRGTGLDPEAIATDAPQIIEIDSDGRIAAIVVFDPEHIEAAFAELDARYLAGEAAAHAGTWSVIMQAYAAANRHEIAAASPNLVNIDHRLLAMIESGDMIAYLRNTFDDVTDINTYPEAVHRLTDIGAVFTHVGTGTSKQGFQAEWRMISLIVVEDNLASRCETFDETDVDAALARFEELQPQTPRLENAASRADDRLVAYFAARDWDAATETLTDDYYSDDRRHVVNVGLQHGRDVAIANMKTSVDLRITFGRSDVIATRGDRLILSRARWSGPDQRPEAFHTEVLSVVEVNADERVAARVMFDANDIDAAFAELDARYIASEARPCSRTWSVIAGAHAGFSQHELTTTTPDSVYIDHRALLSTEAVDLAAANRAVRDLTQGVSIHIEAVHRLSERGAVVTDALKGTSQDGFVAEWRMTVIVTVAGELISRCEIFDEADLDAALARFDELHSQARQLENAASRADERVLACFAARDWHGVTEFLADDFYSDDRRPVVNVGIRHGRDVAIANMQTSTDLGITFAMSEPIATRGGRLVLSRARWSGGDRRP
ncbi:MAG TPA: hypothetical protein VEH77_00490, partial [Roseiarcus sp.]|nr:hypothetical protein [Roseiarcus sp.]